MHSSEFNHRKWHKAAAKLKARLDTDYRNHAMLCDPWKRVAHSMVQGWRNISSQGRLDYIPQVQKSFSTWKSAACQMKFLFDGRRKSRLLNQNTWEFWCHHIPNVALRYIRKANQWHRVQPVE
jgi:hypothetical protein